LNLIRLWFIRGRISLYYIYRNSVYVCFLLGNSRRSEFCMPTFRNTLSIPFSYLPAYDDGTDRVFRNVDIQNTDAGELPRRKHITFRPGESLKWRIIQYMLNGSYIFKINGKRKLFSRNTIIISFIGSGYMFRIE